MTDLREKALGYIRTNWGAPFVLAFIALLIASAALLSAGRSSTANSIAVYAFYALVLGVVLQIASYIRYGENEQEEPTSYIPSSSAPPRSFRPGRRTLAILVVAIVLIAGIGSAIYYKPSTSITTHTTTRTIGRLSAGVNFITTNPGPNNSVQLTIGINETGGLAPYNFTVNWSDGVNQTNDVGVFIRAFLQNQSIPTSATAIVSSTDGQISKLSVTIPNVTRTIASISATSSTNTRSTTSTTTSSSATSQSMIFSESGLPQGTTWSVTLSNAVTRYSNATQIIFSYPMGTYSYSISEPYDQNYFAYAYIATPVTGIVNLNRTNIQENITFARIGVSSPTDQLFNMTTQPIITNFHGTPSMNITYSNSFPVPLVAIVFAQIKNISTGAIISEATATINPGGAGEQSTLLVFGKLGSGNYSATIFVDSNLLIPLSQVTVISLTVP